MWGYTYIYCKNNRVLLICHWTNQKLWLFSCNKCVYPYIQCSSFKLLSPYIWCLTRFNIDINLASPELAEFILRHWWVLRLLPMGSSLGKYTTDDFEVWQCSVDKFCWKWSKNHQVFVQGKLPYRSISSTCHEEPTLDQREGNDDANSF